MIQIIKANLSDAELIADISRETFVETFAAHNTPADMDLFLSRQFTKEKLIEEARITGHIFLLAYVEGLPAGYVFLKEGSIAALPTPNAIEISRLYALKSFIGKGIGKALMDAAVSQALTMNKAYIWLGVWEQNLRAINFYSKYGFKKFSEHDFTLGNDVQKDWLMQRKVIL